MSEKNIKVRLQQKHDTSANWALATNFKPKAGELIIYDDLKKMKVGDGETLVNNLPFLSAEVSQPDYNQNNSTAADYIKNRPFYEEAPTIETILDQTFSTITANGVNFWATNTSVIQFVKGDTVKVVYNGTEYVQEVKELNAVLYVGNIGLGGLSPATDEPFLVANIYFPDGLSTLTPGTTVATSTAQTNATIKITKETENVKTIDPKYIKDMYYTKSDVGEKTLVFTGSINGLIEDFSSTFEAGNVIELKEDSIGLNVTDYAKKYTFSNGTIIYIGNLYIFAELMPEENIVDTKEDYCLIFVTYNNNSSPQLCYANKNCKPPHNIEVYKSTDPIVRIPEKYLPLDIAKKSYVDTTINNAITNLVTLDTEQTITGLKTYAAPANISDTEQVTTKFMTSNGGSISIGKEDANSGTMLRFDQVDGTCRLKFRASATAGAMVWEQPESNAALFFDLGNETGSGKNRIKLRNKAGDIALTNELPAAVSANPTLAGSESELTSIKIGDITYKVADVTLAGNNTFTGTNSFTSAQVTANFGIKGTAYNLSQSNTTDSTTAALVLGGTAAGSTTTTYKVGAIANKGVTLTLPTAAGTFATQEYVTTQIGNIDTLLTALNSGTGV